MIESIGLLAEACRRELPDWEWLSSPSFTGDDKGLLKCRQYRQLDGGKYGVYRAKFGAIGVLTDELVVSLVDGGAGRLAAMLIECAGLLAVGGSYPCFVVWENDEGDLTIMPTVL